MSKAMPPVLGDALAGAATVEQDAVLARRAVGQSRLPDPERLVVTLTDPDLLQAVVDGLDRLNPEGTVDDGR